MRKKILSISAGFCALMMILLTACSESTDVGVDLLDQDQVGVALIDTLQLNSITERNDSVISPNISGYSLTYPSGNFDDPVFGRTNASFYMQLLPSALYSNSTFTNAIVDSVVLSMAYDSVAFGDVSTARTLGVYRVTQDIAAQDYYSNTTFSTESPALAEKTFTPKIKTADKVTVLSYLDDTTKLTLNAHLRIRLDSKIGKEILSLDSTTLNTNSLFITKFKGLHIKPLSDDKGLINFFITKYTTTAGSYNLLTNVNIYYRDNSNARKIMTLYASETARKAVNFQSNPSITIQKAIKNQTIGDSVVYLQGMNGPDIKVTIPNIKRLKDKGLLINKAELELFVKVTPDNFQNPEQLIIRKRNIGTLADDLIDDVKFANNSSSSLIPFGGKPEKVTINGVTLWKYKFNMSAFAQQMMNESSTYESFYVTYANKSSHISRATFYGAKHQKYPMKFRLYYTKL